MPRATRGAVRPGSVVSKRKVRSIVDGAAEVVGRAHPPVPGALGVERASTVNGTCPAVRDAGVERVRHAVGGDELRGHGRRAHDLVARAARRLARARRSAAARRRRRVDAGVLDEQRLLDGALAARAARPVQQLAVERGGHRRRRSRAPAAVTAPSRTIVCASS